MTRIGSAIFNGDHLRLGDEIARVEGAGVEFLHLDVFDGYAARDQGFSARTVGAIVRGTRLPVEVHLSAREPERFIGALAEAGLGEARGGQRGLVFLPVEHTPLLYEGIYAVREAGLRVGVCLALGTPLETLGPVAELVDSVLLLGRVTGEGSRGREFNTLLLDRVRRVREMVGARADVQAAGGLETESCVAAVGAGASSLPIGAALHREADIGAYVRMLRQKCDGGKATAHPHSVVANNAKSTRVLVASRSFGKNCPEVLERMRAAGCEFVGTGVERAPTEEEMVGLVAGVEGIDVIVSGTEPVTARVLAAAGERLRVISKHGVGYENIDVGEAKRRGVRVCVAGGAIADSVADLAMGLVLAVVRGVCAGDRGVRAGGWPRVVGAELRGKVLGVVGLGQIGKGLVRRAGGFGMRCVAYDTYRDEVFAATWGVKYAGLDELLGDADVVSLHAPVTEKTRGMIGREALARMKKGGYLVNTARGELVDETALYEALKGGHLAGAGSDVFSTEPPGAGHPLLTLDNFVATPHIAGQTVEGLRKMGEITGENVLRVLAGKKPSFEL